ncbi:MAG: Unknown protein [uncultured Thiotrichaceae bacterium]|uniref:LysM domain-containing protein n=1 Tax=uncultured Thiotrichaceae bacterium TaxID=298394 RepID=A0A6S6U9S3_9GAMM|nr:MAG: Unknown protein [uncultured Thiotrichaceae bacterium]
MQKLSTLLGSILLTGCSLAIEPNLSQRPIPAADPIIINTSPTTIKAPVSELEETSAIKSPKEGEAYYIVKKKDTVFEIMRQTGVDWQTIIELNDLKAPKYQIHPGQQLRIK